MGELSGEDSVRAARDAARAEQANGAGQPSGALAHAPPNASPPDEEVAWVRAMDRRYQRVYGNASAVGFGAWLLCVVAFVWGLGWQWSLLLLVPSSFLLMVMLMRMAIHSRGAPLYAEAQARAATTDGIEAMIERARALKPRPDFFLSLTDGPLMRNQRALAAQAAPKAAPRPDPGGRP